MELTKQKLTQRFQNQTYGYQTGNVARRWIDSEVDTHTHTHTTIYKTDAEKNVLYSTGKLIQHYVITYMGKEPEKEWRYKYMYIFFSLLYF